MRAARRLIAVRRPRSNRGDDAYAPGLRTLRACSTSYSTFAPSARLLNPSPHALGQHRRSPRPGPCRHERLSKHLVDGVLGCPCAAHSQILGDRDAASPSFIIVTPS